MCGISGFLGRGDDRVLTRMEECLAHRGPDDARHWSDPRAGVGLAHRRLSILDLSPTGQQPMASADGRFVITFNGEIYNFVELRDELVKGGRSFRGTSDTEVLLGCIEAWGVEATLDRANGMFAFALWDRTAGVLHLARDRLGEKPLYYSRVGATFVFGSELRALRAHPDFVGRVDRGAVALLLRHNCIPAPYTIYDGVRQLPPGCRLEVRPGQDVPAPVPFWSLPAVAGEGVRAPLEAGDDEAATLLEALLRDAVGLRMCADVPLGAFLSGGIDSSTIVALMQAQSSAPVRTFTIGYHDVAYDEATHARAVAGHIGTEHTEQYVTAEEALQVVPRLADIYDEPFADASQIPTYLVSRLARKQVKVALSGDGGDEVFGGYNRYTWAPAAWARVRALPRPLRAAAGRALRAPSPATWDAVFRGAAPLMPRRYRQRQPGEKLHKFGEAVSARDPEAMHLAFASHWKDPARVVRGAREPPTAFTDPARALQLSDPVARMMALDTVTYLPDDILVKVDRAAMACSLEVRVPFLDPRVVAFAWRLPAQKKIRDGQGKWLLREVLHRHVPKALVDRPKAGFGVPIAEWLRGPLRGWAENLLDERLLRSQGIFHPQPIRTKWREHLSGRRNWQYHLWDVLMFQLWLERHHAA